MQVSQPCSRRTLLQWGCSLVGISVVSFALSACNRASEQDEMPLELACDGDKFAFDKTTLTAPVGQQVRLTFKNVSTNMHHNWVLVAGGQEIADQVNQASTAAGPSQNYLPADQSLILAHTKLTMPGESDTVTFTTPAQAGEYSYLCTFPGHYLAGMKGILVITA